MWLKCLTNYCLQHNIITEDDIPWFQYGIEKRISTIIVGIPVFILAVLLSNFLTAIAFYISFYFLRTRTNGYHAKTLLKCLLFSLLSLFLFMYAIYHFLDTNSAMYVSALCTVIIWILAPFNNPNMNYTNEEYEACKKSSRFRSAGILICVTIAYIANARKIVIGLTLGVAMAAFFLCLAYILNGGIHHENHTGKD